MHGTKGFTLIELMIVIAILALLTVIGLPAYRDSIRESNRADAKITLSRLATLEERHFFRTNQYTDDFADLISGVTSGDPIASDEGHYSIALSGDATSWSMTATAVGEQANDTDCAKLILSNLGQKTSKDADGNASTGCW